MSAPRNRYKLEHGELENYSKGRFFTVTGDIVAGASTKVEPRQTEFDALIADLDERLAAGKKKPKAASAGKGKKKSAESDAAVLSASSPRRSASACWRATSATTTTIGRPATSLSPAR